MSGIYLHIPYCKKACHYCNFHFSTNFKNKMLLVEALHQEILLRKDFFDGQEVETIYFGGGTPSILSAAEINTLIASLAAVHPISKEAEITLEANPDDLTLDKIEELKNTPINRLSIGVQSFREQDLQWMNRAHNAQQSNDCIKRAQDHGFDNLTIDLIYGLPHLSNEDWQHNLETFFKLNINHLSAYCLTVEPQTALDHFIKTKKEPPLDELKARNQMLLLMEAIPANGFEQYEISNFAKNNKYARHNSSYWKGKSYLGLGPAAHSFSGNQRMWNVANNAKYIHSIQKNVLPLNTEILSKNDHFNEMVMLGLRTIWGIRKDKVLTDFSENDWNKLVLEAEAFEQKKWLTIQDDCIVLTTQGRLKADFIAGELFV